MLIEGIPMRSLRRLERRGANSFRSLSGTDPAGRAWWYSANVADMIIRLFGAVFIFDGAIASLRPVVRLGLARGSVGVDEIMIAW